MALQTWVAKFVVDHGKVTEEGGRLRTFERRRIDEPDVDLYILSEPMGGKGEELTAQALDAIGRLFLQDRLSLTGGLMRALRSTHQTLLDWNQRSLPNDQVSAGLAAAIVSGHILYLAQTGPGVAFLKQNGKLERLQPDDPTALGDGEIEPALRRLELSPGDMLVAASPSIETLLDADELAALLDRGSDAALPELYLLTRDLPNFALFAISCNEGDDDSIPETLPLEAETEHDFALANPESTPGVSRTPPALLLEPSPEPEKPEAVLITPPPLDISRPVVRLRSDQSIGRSEYARTTGDHSFKLNIFDARLMRWVFVAAAILLVVAFVPGLVQQGRSQKLDTLVQSAQIQLDAAASSPEPGEKRALLEETRRLATEALRLDGGNEFAKDLAQQATTSLSTLDAVTNLGTMTTVTTLSRQVTGDVSIQAMTIAGGSAYLLDAKGGRVIAVSLGTSGTPSTVFQDGETYSGTPAKKPMFLAWDSSDPNGRLLVLDSERKLFEIRPGNLAKPLPLRRSSSWASVTAMTVSGGNLFILDAKGNQVHRYLPAQQGFDSEPTDVINGQPDLSTAAGMEVGRDIYVYFKDASIRHYHDGGDAGFSLAGIDRQLKGLASISLSAGGDELYLADSGNKRIVVAGSDGSFRRQYVSNAFTDLRAAAVDANGTIYAMVGDALLSSTQPPR